jgi:hypothetical protein
MTTELIKCTCASEFQDKMYGMGIRVGNLTSSGQLRCTICKTVGGAQTTATAKVPVITAAPVEEPKKASAAPVKKKSGGNSGGKDIKKEKAGKKSMKDNKR